MKYFRENNLLFVHIPRTGGTSLCDFLWNNLEVGELVNGQAHGLLQDSLNLINKDTKIITVVRNPYDRAVSFYHKLITQDNDLYPNAEPAKACRDFTDYVPVFVYEENPQMFFLKTSKPLPVKIEVIRFEYLVSDAEKILAEYNLDFSKFPHLHGSKHEHWSTYYNKYLYNLINQRERELFDLGYYKREGI